MPPPPCQLLTRACYYYCCHYHYFADEDSEAQRGAGLSAGLRPPVLREHGAHGKYLGGRPLCYARRPSRSSINYYIPELLSGLYRGGNWGTATLRNLPKATGLGSGKLSITPGGQGSTGENASCLLLPSPSWHRDLHLHPGGCSPGFSRCTWDPRSLHMGVSCHMAAPRWLQPPCAAVRGQCAPGGGSSAVAWGKVLSFITWTTCGVLTDFVAR